MLCQVLVDIPEETWHGFWTVVLEWEQILIGLEEARGRAEEERLRRLRDEGLQLDLGLGW